jgi:ankyrin repeat protein
MFKKKQSFTELNLLKELLSHVFDQKKIDNIYNNAEININWQNDNGESFLHLCAKGTYIESIKWLLKKDINVELQTEDNSTALFYALRSNNLTLVKSLIEAGVNLNHLNVYNRSVTQEAVISGNSRLIDYLIETSTNLNNEDVHGNNLIFDAVSNGKKEIIRQVANLEDVDINHINHAGNIVLQQESILKNNQLAIELMELGSDPTIQDKNGKNFLFYAISKGIKNLEILEKAVSLGCNINTRCEGNKTILIESMSHYLKVAKEDKEERENHLLMIKELISKGVEIDALDEEKENAFFLATRSQEKDLIEIFLGNSIISINHQNIHGDTVFSILVRYGVSNIDLILKYLEHGANPNRKNTNNKTSIEVLVDIILFYQNHQELDPKIEKLLDPNGEYSTLLTKILKNSKVDLNQLNSEGKPLFFSSVLNFNLNLFKIFRDNNINLNLKDTKDHNIIFELMDYNTSHTIKDQKQYLDMLQNLLNIGVDVDAKNKEGLTALHKAVVEKCEYTVRLLLESKADTMAKDNKGRSIIHNCIWKDNTRYFKLIHSYNNDIINIPDSFGLKPINYAAFMGKKDLVIQMLDAGALVNNSYDKDIKILKFFEKFHKNIVNIDHGVENEVDRKSLKILAEAMIKEFDIKIKE